MRRAVLLLLPSALLVMSACGGDDDASDPVPTAAAPPATTVEPATTAGPAGTLRPSDDTVSLVPATSTPPAPGSGPRGTAEELAAVDDLARRLDVDPSAITVVSTDEVTWRDGSIGCPEPGMNYTQALVPGIRVVLEVDGVRYEYHAGGARPIFWCEKPQAPVEG
jgi:hypothetical protein